MPRSRGCSKRRGIAAAACCAGSDSHPIHAAITRDDTNEVRRLLDADPGLVDVGNAHRRIAAPSSRRPRCARARRAAARSWRQRACRPQLRARPRRRVLDRSSSDRSRHLGRASPRRPPHDPVAARARCDARSDGGRGARRHRTRPADPRREPGANPGNAAERTATALGGRRAGHDAIARLLLERGADPNWGEPTAPKGRSLHVAAGAGQARAGRVTPRARRGSEQQRGFLRQCGFRGGHTRDSRASRGSRRNARSVRYELDRRR